MLKENQFSICARRVNIKTYLDTIFVDIDELVELHEEHGAVSTHERLPVVSELWFYIMYMLRPYDHLKRSLNFLKDEISNHLCEYINNSAMLPDYGQKSNENISTILTIHMSKCNKSAMILESPTAFTIHTIQKQQGKPSYLGKESVLEMFNGYTFNNYFPTSLYYRPRYLFDAGIFE